MTAPTQTAINDRRIGARESTPKPAPPRDDQPPKVWPAWALKMRQDYEANIRALEERLHDLEMSIVDQRNAQRRADNNNALALYGESDDVKGLAARLKVILPNSDELGITGVTLVAQVAMMHGLDPLPGSDHIYAWKQTNKRTGQKELKVVIGYKGLIHLARKRVKFTYQSRPMTEVEHDEHGIQDGQIGYVTALYEIADAIDCKAAGIPYHPIIGTAVWKPGDEIPKGRSAAWVAKKNSLKDALRQITTTGQRMSEALDEAFRQLGQQLGSSVKADLEYTDDGWRMALPDGLEEAAIEAGIVPPSSDGAPSDDGDEHISQAVIEHQPNPAPAEPAGEQQAPTDVDTQAEKATEPTAPAVDTLPKCENCGIEPGEETPVGWLCKTCARRKADEKAATEN